MTSTLKADKIEGVTASGTVQMPAGMVIQTVYTDPVGTETNVTANSFTDTGLSLTITPKFSTSKTLILIPFPVYIFGNRQTTEPKASVRLMRSIGGGSYSSITTFQDGDDTTFKHELSANSDWNIDHGTFTHFDDHNTASQIIYKVQFKCTSASGTIRIANGNTTANSPRMFLQEIAQ